MPTDIPRRLDRGLAVSILGIARTDAEFPANVIDNAENEEELRTFAADVVHACRAGGWQKFMKFETRARVLTEYDQHVRVDPAPVDPLAESTARNYNPLDPWQRESALHEPAHVAVIGEPVENKIAADGTGVFRVGGNR